MALYDLNLISAVYLQTPVRNDVGRAASLVVAQEEEQGSASVETAIEHDDEPAVNEAAAAAAAAGCEGGESANNVSTGGVNRSPRTPPRPKREHRFVFSRYLSIFAATKAYVVFFGGVGCMVFFTHV